MRLVVVNIVWFLSFGLSSQINRGFLTVEPVVSAGYPPGTVQCAGSSTATVDVVNPATGKTWMDRNLGAKQVATSSTDALAYGDLYQWGRFSDGHQCRTSATTSTTSATDTPGHGDFITTNTSPFDWLVPQNPNLWLGVNGVNNPCPIGYRVPTEAEWNNEVGSWGGNLDAAGAFGSPLKLPLAGTRRRVDGVIIDVGTQGYYWSSSIGGTDAWRLNYFFVGGGSLNVVTRTRASSYSVRCIKE